MLSQHAGHEPAIFIYLILHLLQEVIAPFQDFGFPEFLPLTIHTKHSVTLWIALILEPLVKPLALSLKTFPLSVSTTIDMVYRKNQNVPFFTESANHSSMRVVPNDIKFKSEDSNSLLFKHLFFVLFSVFLGFCSHLQPISLISVIIFTTSVSSTFSTISCASSNWIATSANFSQYHKTTTVVGVL